jgi:hypothetical protein
MIKRVFQWFILLLIGSGVSLRADGFKFESGRLKGERVMELQLTAEQAKAVTTQFKPGMVIRLTKGQRAQIKALTKVKEVPTKLELWRPSNLENECSCLLWNIGLIFKPGWLELPISRIVSDQEAVDRLPGPND